MTNVEISKYFTQRFYYPRLLFLRQFGKPVLIWNMGKVASTSIARSLWMHVGRHNVLTTHFMNREDYPRSKILFDVLINNCRKSMPIIALTREPVGKNISSFFQNFERNVGIASEQYQSNLNELADFFLNRFDEHDTTINWFDDNLKRYIGLDVYDHSFDPARGYCIVEQGRYIVLILRSEESNEIKERAIKELLGLEEFNLINENVGADKPYSQMYKDFQKVLKLPDSYLEKMLNSRYAQHFYSTSEIENIRAKWTESI